MTNQTAVRNGTTLMNLSYDYGRNGSAGSLNGKTGHLTKIIDNLNANKNREYQFDAIGRLTVAKGKASNQWTQTYVYDRFGNRTSVAATGTAADGSTMPTDGIPNLSFDAASNRITTSGFLYDSAGNQTRALAADGVTWVKYEYDAANRVYQIKKDDANQTLLQVFQYGSTNARLIDYDPTGTGRNTFYATVGGTVLAEYTEYSQNIQSWTKSYTYLGDSQLSTITPNASGGEYTEYNHPDRLGTRLITSQSAGTSYEQAHLPFGKALDAESTITNNNKRFTTYERSAPTGLDYAQNRTYDSKQGRFSQVDPIGMQAVSLAAPQTLNLYTYCGNDPINYTDPSGLFWGFLKKLFKWAVAIIAVVVAVLTIIAAPATIAGVLGAISASAAAGSSVMNALGYSTAAKVFGWIAIATGIGAGLAAAGSNHSLIIKNFASTAETTTPIWQRILGGISAVGAIANAFAKNTNRSGSKRLKSGCDYLQSLYPRIKTFLDSLWKKTIDSKSKTYPTGREAGGYLWISDSEVIPGVGEVFGSATYDGPTTDRSMGRAFDTWLLNQADRVPSGATVVIVHTHPRSTAKPSPGDIGAAITTNTDEAIITKDRIVIFTGNGIKCTYSR